MPSQHTHKKRRAYASLPRTISASKSLAAHPLNVRPLGNSFFAEKTEGVTKEQQLGDFARFEEELFMEILSYIDDANALRNLSHTSRVLYAYLYDEDLWKKMYTTKVQIAEKQGKDIPLLQWRGSWRLSVLGLDAKYSADIQMKGNLVCSDVLYRPFQCSQIDYNNLFAKVIEEEETYHMDSLRTNQPLDFSILPKGRIPRFPEAQLSQELFDSKWHNQPFIFTNADPERWPRWNLESLLRRFADVKFRQEAVQWPLSLYAQYLVKNSDESPLYLFDCNSEAMKTLRQEYDVPQLFQEDHFSVFGDCRPDHAWVIIGSERSGSTFHKDPNYTSAWNAALSGRKLWVMFPPGTCPPGVSADEDESEVTSPVGIAEWVLSGFYNDAAKHPEAQIGITFPGEVMYVPSGWWHSVINLDDSVALTQNFVPKVKVGNAMNFLKNRRSQMSGFHPSAVRRVMDRVISAAGDADDENICKIREYSKKFDELHLQDFLQNEDCGEIVESQLPPMPVFELFTKLLELNGDDAVLKRGLEELTRIEKAEVAKSTGKSETWTKLTETTGFSFGFGGDLDLE
ncbi:putative clavaminate synthase-like protein [Clavispora lusitaniae]|uniref:Clavaminate synthase-like protein n=1 Tax=Clavispora lusitaniae TaxID=36911 RepID=A0AA91SZT0_CLALS|nr:putative clavaminate synthase-like protein [Clavispora lusitaniae]